jgi:hypothetical protein
MHCSFIKQHAFSTTDSRFAAQKTLCPSLSSTHLATDVYPEPDISYQHFSNKNILICDNFKKSKVIFDVKCQFGPKNL